MTTAAAATGDVDSWARLEALFDEGVSIEKARRDAWLASLDVGDALRDELEGMLEADAGGVDGRGLVAGLEAAAASAVMSFEAGQRIGAYRLLREVGSGGFGSVFLAERADDEFHRTVAIKVIRGIADSQAIRQLRRERQILASLEHPGIARLLDGGTTVAGQPYLVMEYVEGQPLTTACEQGAVPLRRRLELLVQVARAVHYAHQRLVIHRDIKPGNVLLRDDGQPVLLDFGIAKLVGDERAGPAQETFRAFTPAYAAPEQRASGVVSTATDVFALGRLLRELVAGPPGNPAALLGDLTHVHACATRDDPNDRYASADAFARDIERYLEGRPISAGPSGALYLARKFVGRHRVGVAATAFAVAALVATTSWSILARARALEAEAHAAREAVAAQAMGTFLIELFENAEPARARGGVLSPVELIDRGAERLRANAEISPAERARVAFALGRIYRYLGEPAKASATLDDAIAAGREAAMAPGPMADLLMESAAAHTGRGVLTESLSLLREALALAESAGDEDRRIEAITAYSDALSRTNGLPQAIVMLEAVIEDATARHGPKSKTVARSQEILAQAYMLAGRTQEAVELMDDVVEVLARELDPGSVDLWHAYSRYASALYRSGELERAEQVALQAIAGRAPYVKDGVSSKLIEMHGRLGAIYRDQGRLRESAQQLGHALRGALEVFGPKDPELSTPLHSDGVIRIERGEPATGIASLRRALAIVSAHPDTHALQTAMHRITLGRALSLAGEPAEARALLEQPVGDGPAARWALQQQRQRLFLAEWHILHGDRREAQRLLEDAEAHLDSVGGRRGLPYLAFLSLRGRVRALDGNRAAVDDWLEAHQVAEAIRPANGFAALMALDLAEWFAGRDRAEAAYWLRRARPVASEMAEGSSARARLAALERQFPGDGKPAP